MKGGEWSPTGDLVAFTDFDSNGTQQLFISKPDGSDLRQITSGNDPSREIRSIRWSPDGSRLVFDAPGQPNKSDFWIYLVERDYLYNLLFDIHDLSISQNSIWWVDKGTKLLFAASASGASLRGTFVFDAEGGLRGYLPEETLKNAPAWVFPINDNGLVGFSAGQFLPGYDSDTTVFYQWDSSSEALDYFTDSTKFNLSEYPDMIDKIVVVGNP
jgi:dipeptidyl aminopeptidase/acylaminoacyl peptidase